MSQIPFIDIHTHKTTQAKNVISVKNLFPDKIIPAFTGNNYYSVGLHPWYIGSRKKNKEQLDQVGKMLGNNHVIFIGECGPDSKASTDFNEQMWVFETQALMAEEFEKPLIIHCVKQYNEVIRIHKKLRPRQPWILHGYNGNLQITRQLVNKNILFSFGQILFIPESKAVESFHFLPDERIFFETDESETGIDKMYEKGALLKVTELEILIKNIQENFNRITNL